MMDLPIILKSLVKLEMDSQIVKILEGENPHYRRIKYRSPWMERCRSLRDNKISLSCLEFDTVIDHLKDKTIIREVLREFGNSFDYMVFITMSSRVDGQYVVNQLASEILNDPDLAVRSKMVRKFSVYTTSIEFSDAIGTMIDLCQ